MPSELSSITWRQRCLRLLTALETGVLSGLVTLGYLVFDAVLHGRGLWAYPNLLGGVIYPYQSRSLLLGGATLAGISLHIVLSGVAGLLFAAAVGRLAARPWRALWLGALLGLAWYFVMFRFVWTKLNPALVVYQPFPGMIFSYVLFGLCMSRYPRRR